MRHLPRTEYTEADQRADTNFLIGARFGRDQERQRVLGDVLAWADDQIQGLPERRTPQAHAKADLIRDLRNWIGGSA